MIKANTILILLMMSFSSMAFSYTNSSEQETADKNTRDSLKQYVGEYVLEETGMIIDIYTKVNDTKLFLFVDGQPEYELVATGEHKFSFEVSDDYKIEFKNPENGVFNELVATQPEGTYTAIRNGELKIYDLTTIDKKLMSKGFSGVILVAQNDSIIFNKAYGKKNSQENGLNDINTVFDICSITKQFTAAGILKLSMQNKVAVNDKISKYFEGVPDDKKNITIHQLLTHSSGLTDGIGDDYDAITEEKFLKKVFRSKLISPVGEQFNYSNMGYSLLGLIIEKVSGMDYETYLNETIFKPSKMYHTGYVIPDWKTNEVANGFLDGTEAKKPNEENWSEKGPYLNLKGNGGLLTRASDLLLWSQAIQDQTVLDEVTTDKYLYPHFEFNDLYTHYGYGWGIENNDSENKLVVHGGASNLFASDLWIYPNKGITIIILSNTQEEYVYSIARRFSDFLLAK
ncbi:serine hydrolase domain-containing protein [Psychroserpens algicola]|uniref:Beta-lactamase family protein n=1 Tax=Psychroserpens algicola TaxID=1719034 RepID=A0ABT0HAZ3_9FLAO|nr:serine hydrolase domain-containing protein [Psychroserpens algicola]MCK8481511.1 beta-lactamase family protein [Psychroserpens algicola]